MKRVLVIDDDEITRDLLKGVLENEFHVETAESLADGLAAYQANPFDLVVTDIVMPEKDGLETIYEFKRLEIFLPIIAISGQTIFQDESYREMVSRIGADAFLLKPIDPNELINKIQELTQ